MEPLKSTPPGSANRPRKPSTLRQIGSMLDFLFKSAGLIVWFVIFFLALLEIKRYYNIDLIPGYDSAVDDVYGAARGTLSEFLK